MAEGLLLTPYFQTEVGIVFFRVPKDVSPAAFGERTLLQPAPTDLATVKSGKVANFSANLTACKELTAFAKAQAVRKRLNERDKSYGELPYQRFVKSIQTCQCRDGKYCHPEKTQVETENGMVQLCWHHDRLRMEDKIGADCLAEIADKNWELFIAQTIRQTLGKQDKTIEFSDLVLFALIKGLINELDSDRLQRFLKYPDLPESSVTKESSIGFDVPNAKVNLKTWGEKLKLKVEPEPLAAFLAIPKLQRFEWRKWLQYVKAQPCVCCGQQADDPHHLIGYGGAMGSKRHDLFTLPLCRIHHDELHHNVAKFEADYGSQSDLLVKVLDRALGLGALVIDG
ncbi:putative bacteriophage protein [Bibersteinia trehalosi USDA-ARS-USMARC-189]|uniref:Bacteriophage protein n=1 Tax=Bibersteinia trehalosi USDA-ARS-USMARC-189 TaxID=1263831 RepID=A0ABM5PAU9_BIBTR|nr:DUF968 domain-containing protein [Bibersteinia trehalosi]AHG83069.1 putative bacteriophage protein [Bibersteinia trehalosi USDA-ARS-USMARC-189]